MLWLKAIHIICMVTWFAGLFYLPRLFVYHTQVSDTIENQRFKVMEHKLFYYITTPGGILTILTGAGLFHTHLYYYQHVMWMHIKLLSIAALVLFHIYCGKLLHDFKRDQNKHGETFYRWLNEFPTVILILVVILVVVKPFDFLTQIAI